MKRFESLQNPTIKKITQLQTTQKRKQYKQFIAEGLRTCKTLLESSIQLVQLYTTENMESQAKQLTHEKNISLVSDKIMGKIAPTKTPSGMLSVFTIPKETKPTTMKAGLVLANISDPGNMGTLIRSSVAFGFSQIILIEGCDPWNPRTVQASAGTIGEAQIIKMSWPELVAFKNRPLLCALCPKKGEKIKSEQKNQLLVIGNEAHGIPEEWCQDCEKMITLSMPGNAESLNAAVAGSIALYLSVNK